MNPNYITEIENYKATIGSLSESDLKYQNDLNSIISVRTSKYTNGNSNEIIEPKKRIGGKNNLTLIIISILVFISFVISISALTLVLIQRNYILNYKSNF
jgi:hypothetical protein